MNGERGYLDLLREVLEGGARKTDRTGTGTLSVFGRQLRFDLRDSFPLLTTKKLHVKSIVCELLWFLRGETNVRWLQERGVKIWDEWADENGDLGPVYGSQWRSWPDGRGGTIDQIANVIEAIKSKPDSRRHIVTAWNPAEVDEMPLPRLTLNPDRRSIFDFEFEDFMLTGYDPHPHIKAEVSV